MAYIGEGGGSPFGTQVVRVGGLALGVGMPIGQDVETEEENLLVVDVGGDHQLIAAAESGGLGQCSHFRLAVRVQAVNRRVDVALAFQVHAAAGDVVEAEAGGLGDLGGNSDVCLGILRRAGSGRAH